MSQPEYVSVTCPHCGNYGAFFGAPACGVCCGRGVIYQEAAGNPDEQLAGACGKGICCKTDGHEGPCDF